jgi:hypothetical protein
MTGRDMMGVCAMECSGHGIKVCYTDVREADHLIIKIATEFIVFLVNERRKVKKTVFI